MAELCGEWVRMLFIPSEAATTLRLTRNLSRYSSHHAFSYSRLWTTGLGRPDWLLALALSIALRLMEATWLGPVWLQTPGSWNLFMWLPDGDTDGFSPNRTRVAVAVALTMAAAWVVALLLRLGAVFPALLVAQSMVAEMMASRFGISYPGLHASMAAAKLASALL